MESTYRKPGGAQWVRTAFDRAWPIPEAHGLRALLNDEDVARAQALLDAHPDRTDKIGTGVLAFALAEAGDRIHIGIVHPDGTMSRLRQRKPEVVTGHRQRVIRTLRDAVSAQVLNARRALIDGGQAACVLCGSTERLTTDHYPVGFIAIADAWLTTRSDVPLTRDPLLADGAAHRHSSRRLASPTQAASWQAFHHARASYRILCHRCNTSAPRRRVATPEEKDEEPMHPDTTQASKKESPA